MDQQLRFHDLKMWTGPILSSRIVAHRKCTSGLKDLASADTRHAHAVQTYMKAKYQYT